MSECVLADRNMDITVLSPHPPVCRPVGTWEFHQRSGSQIKECVLVPYTCLGTMDSLQPSNFFPETPCPFHRYPLQSFSHTRTCT